MLEGEEHFLRDSLPYYPISDSYAEKLLKKLSVYKKEKSLYYGLYLLTGKDVSKTDTMAKLCFPLFLFPAQVIETDMGEYGIAIDKTNLVVNVRDLFRLKEQEQDMYASYVNKIPDEFWSEEGFMELSKLLQDTFSNINTGFGLKYPVLYDEKEVKKQMSSRQLQNQEDMKLVPAAFFAVLNNPRSSTGVLDELEQLTEEKDYSAALKAVLGEEQPVRQLVSPHRYVAPGSLSRAQQKAITNAIEYPLSLVVGPPGTGKSYTIANLAIDQLAQGRTVLIASKTDIAVDVIHHKIEEILDELLVSVRAGQRGYKQKIRAHFSNLLSGTNRYYTLEEELNPFHWSKLLAAADKELAQLKAELPQKLQKAARRGKSLSKANDKKGLLSWLSKSFIRMEQAYTPAVWIKGERMEELTAKRAIYAKKYIQGRFLYHLLFTLKKYRKDIARFDKALRSRVSGNKEKLFSEVRLQAVLDALPIWLVNLNEVYQALPLEKELFDLAIIDEATQCDISSCLPILQRAKKVVIVGDPKQLRHVSFLSRTAQRQLLSKYGLAGHSNEWFNYRDNSILDLVNLKLASQDQLSFLNEHFRSSPAIIRFSNEQFYNNSLSIMKEFPHHEQEPLIFREVKGKRCKRGINEAEARELLAEVQGLLASEEEVSASLCKKIGILSPFRDQADFLAKLLEEEVPLEKLQKHQLLVGTAYSFQGEERDVMLLSFALDDDSHHSAFRYLEKHDVFNVSITRARSIQQIFYSFNVRKLPGQSLVKRYIANSLGEQELRSSGTGSEKFGVEVEAYLQEQGFSCWKGYVLMGEQLDFLVKAGSSYIGLDLIGFPDENAKDIPLEKYQAFSRAGLKIFPLPYINWYFNKEETRKAILEVMRYA